MTANDLTTLANEHARLSAIEARLITHWQALEASTHVNTALLVNQKAREWMTVIEGLLGYRPQAVGVLEGDNSDGD